MTQKCDVLVVGGGPAGIAAAVAAARNGAGTILLEQYGFLGGLATAGMVGTICGLYHRTEDSQPRFLCGGFAREWARNLAQSSASEPVLMPAGLYVLPYNVWAFQILADRFCREMPGLELILHATAVSLKVHQRRVEQLRVLSSGKEMTFQPNCIIDCSGDATIPYLAGCSVGESTSQAAGVLFTMAPVDGSLHTTEGRVSALRQIAQGAAKGRLNPACGQVCFVQTPPFAAHASLKLSLVDSSNDPYSGMTRLEVKARELIDDLSRFLVSEVPAFKSSQLTRVAAQVGVRVGRRIKGRSVLSETDVLECKKFDDGVACGAWPIEEWDIQGRPRLTCLPVGRYYEIPLGCLVADELDNVFAAGRCISACEKALCSARVIGTAMATGYAAGFAAAACAANRTLSIAVQQLRKEQVPGDV